MSRKKTQYLKDYQSPDFKVAGLELYFDIHEQFTTVTARMHIVKINVTVTELCLQGEALDLQSIQLDGVELDAGQYQLTEQSLSISGIPETFDLTIVTKLYPHKNTLLMGLYRSHDYFVTQCEPEGFRRITYFLDRPDVLTLYTTTIEADREKFPVLLSNGNCVSKIETETGRHIVKWQDPHPKPSYLFALVAGNLACLEDSFVTRSNRTVRLQIYAKANDIAHCSYALKCLQQAMAWDEQSYGREYDLDVYMIVAVADFNMGAMENKGLNIFNTKYVLVDATTATDQDFQNVQSVIGHEYFHNWSGNRVTCRDWFQLSLKEGLTIFRDQSFSADLNSATVKRIQDVRVLRTVQFAEDHGPMAHPVQPASYMEINNFYTVTIYNKGAEVIRMLHTLIGETVFRQGMDLYFERHDGQAVTINEFVSAMEEAAGCNLSQFKRWYEQAGTPELTISDQYHAKTQQYTITIKQHKPPFKKQLSMKDFHIPIRMGLANEQGKAITINGVSPKVAFNNSTCLLELKHPEQSWTFEGITQAPIPSLLHQFSAPVKWHYDYSDDQLSLLMKHDTDTFSRWDAGQKLMLHAILGCVEDSQQQRALCMNEVLLQAVQHVLENPEADESFMAELLCLPSERYVAEFMSVIDPTAIHVARQFIKQQLALSLHKHWLHHYEQRYAANEKYEMTAQAIAKRSFKNLCLGYLVQNHSPDTMEACYRQFQQASNMTDSLAVLTLLVHHDNPKRMRVLEDFYQQWKHHPLVIDKWFAIQASSPLVDTTQRVRSLLTHADFCNTNPNRVRALLGTFVHQNAYHFHEKSGQNYAWIADQIIVLDVINPHTAATLVNVFNHWRLYDNERQAKMQQQLQRILATTTLSTDVFEIVSKALA